jgi:hypothetical protein
LNKHIISRSDLTTPISLNTERTVGLCELNSPGICIGKFDLPRLLEWTSSILENFGDGEVCISFENGALVATVEKGDEVGVCVAGCND